jgi:hypothetical protein
MNSKQIIKKLNADGWYLARVKGSHLRSLLVAGAASAPTAVADAAYFDGLRERVRKPSAAGTHG